MSMTEEAAKELLTIVKDIRRHQEDRFGEESEALEQFRGQRDELRRRSDAAALAIREAADENAICSGLASDLVDILQGKSK